MPSFYSPKLGLTFIHNPRTGGTSIGLAINRIDPKVIFWWDHRSIDRDIINMSKTSFSIVRNPWDRAVSGYYFFKQGQLHRNKHQANILKQKLYDINNIVDDFPTFEMWVKNLCNFKVPKEIIFIDFHTPQVEIVKQTTHILKYEDLDNGLKNIENLLHFKFNHISNNFNVSVRDKNYQNYYSDSATKNIIGDIFYEDIVKFNYKF